jgi:hypothetical protein
MDRVASDSLRSTAHARWDIWLFIGAYLAGTAYYVVGRWALPAAGASGSTQQVLLTVGILMCMLAYAGAAVWIPRLRVRLDQAGDNAYYLGLLFTLTSMAFALWDFRGAIESADLVRGTDLGAKQIIANFGIALATTIAGIFLRIVLHQMRVDPGDVEAMTRIELAEASKRVRAVLETLSLDIAQFHEEMRQRSADALSALFEDVKSKAASLGERVDAAAQGLADVAKASESNVLQVTGGLVGELTSLTEQAAAATDRLRAIEGPPAGLTVRLEKLGESLKVVSEQTDGLVAGFRATATTTQEASASLVLAARSMADASVQIRATSEATAAGVSAAVDRVSTALESIARKVEVETAALAELEQQSTRSAEQAARVQQIAVNVLEDLASATRGLAATVRQQGGAGGGR